MKRSLRTLRIAYASATLLLFLLELYIALYVHDTFVRPYLGDAIVVVLVYTFVRIFFPRRFRLLPLYVFLFACCVEFSQALHLVDLLGLNGNAFFRTLLGTSFAWADFLCYAAGCAVLGAYEFLFWKFSYGNFSYGKREHKPSR